jgi:hypothetical protein
MKLALFQELLDLNRGSIKFSAALSEWRKHASSRVTWSGALAPT